MALSRSKLSFAAAALLVWGVHLALAAYFVAPSALMADRPIDGSDFDTHIAQTYRVLEGLSGWGKSWVYDVHLLAGQPEGTIFDADNKGWELWTYFGVKLGMSRAHAFNSFIAFAQVSVPLIVACAAALLGLQPASCLLAALMSSTIWFFDSFAHWAWWIGMVEYAFAAVFFLLPLTLFHRFAIGRSRAAGVAFVPLLALSLLLHPYSFFMLALPLAVMYLRARRELSRVDHALVLLAVIATLALNAYWLGPALQHWHYILNSAYYGQTGLGHLLADLVDLLLDPSDTGVIGTRAAFRIAYLIMSVAALVFWSRAGDPRRIGMAAALGGLFVLAYLGSYLPGGAHIQPYRHVLPLGFLVCLLAAGFVEQLVRSRGLQGLRAPGFALLGVCALGLAQHFARNVIYFFPDELPKVKALIDGTPAPLTATGYRAVANYRIPHETDRWIHLREISDWIAQHIPAGDRALIEEMHLGEHIAWFTGIEVLGGFRQRNIEHSYANFFRRYEHRVASHAELADYLRTYAVRWVIARTKRTDFETETDLLEPLGVIEDRHIYRARIAYGKVLGGGGRALGRTNAIFVWDTSPAEPVVLSYHYHEKLVCEPGCAVQREPSAFDRVGLIRIPAPHPAAMKILLRY